MRESNSDIKENDSDNIVANITEELRLLKLKKEEIEVEYNKDLNQSNKLEQQKEYIEDELDYHVDGLSGTIQDAVDAYNGGAR